MKRRDMYKNFRKFLKKVSTTNIDMSQRVIIEGFNWSLANGQYWNSYNPLAPWADKVELLHVFDGSEPGSHRDASYQALIYKDGSVSINGDGLNKRMDKLLRDNADTIAKMVWG